MDTCVGMAESLRSPPETITTLFVNRLTLLDSWDFPGKNTGVGYHFFLQGIFPTQGSTPSLLHRQAGSLLLSHQGSPLLTTLDTYFHLFMVEKTKAQTGYGLIRKDTTYPKETLIMVAL